MHSKARDLACVGADDARVHKVLSKCLGRASREIEKLKIADKRNAAAKGEDVEDPLVFSKRGRRKKGSQAILRGLGKNKRVPRRKSRGSN